MVQIKERTIKWHSLSVADAYAKLDSSDSGLSSAEAMSRLRRDGKNVIEQATRTTVAELLLKQFNNYFIFILLAAALISASLGVLEGSMQEAIEASLILLIVGFIVALGFYQEYRAERELEALKNLLSPLASVIRDGGESEIDASTLVVGDVVKLVEGKKVPADCKIIRSNQLRVDESSLTGESLPVEKILGDLDESTLIGDRTNMLFGGTAVVHGHSLALVVETGMKTELGIIASSLQAIKKEKTPLQERLDKLGKQFGLATLVLCVAMFLLGYFGQAKSFIEIFMISVALGVAAVPEGLPGVVTIALARGVRRMVKINCIVRKLTAVETLGSTTVICTDKTGTLTKNEMTAKKLWADGKMYSLLDKGVGTVGALLDENGNKCGAIPDVVKKQVLIGVLCNHATMQNGSVSGDPTEAALVSLGAKLGFVKSSLVNDYERLDEIPFDSKRKMASFLYGAPDGRYVYSLGAPEVILGRSNRIISAERVELLTPLLRDKVLATYDGLASDAYRVLGFSYRPCADGVLLEDLEPSDVFIGLVGIIDPPREEVREAVSKCVAAGIKVVMITGDYQLTAKAIAKDLGIFKDSDTILTGGELAQKSDAEFLETVEEVSVYARVSPSDKLKIVEALQARGHVVAMTGDGVNDAPALKKSDIGVAMGLSGTDVSKEAADMVLADDNFSSIVRAVEEGRGIYDNIRKFFAYLVSGNVGEIILVFVSSALTSLPVALTASQILVINLISDGLPALALGLDPFEPNAMTRRPRPKDEPIYRGLGPFLLGYPLVMATITLLLVYWVYDSSNANLAQAQTTAFISVAIFELFHGFSARSTRFPVWKVGFTQNKYLLLAMSLSFIFVCALLYLPVNIPYTNHSLQAVMSLTPLPFSLLMTVIAASTLGFIYIELHKFLRCRASLKVSANR